MRYVLGSQSGGRKKVLEKMGLTFEILPSYIDEKMIRSEDPVELTRALANAKANAILPHLKTPAILITSDQVIVCKSKILEKPTDETEARAFLRQYSDHPIQTVTSVVVVNSRTGERAGGTDIARITFRMIPDSVIDEYIATGDPFIHAGGFDHEHRLLAPYVSSISGEPESIIGMPRSLTEGLINMVK